MLISKEFFDQLDSSYQKVIIKLEEELDACKAQRDDPHERLQYEAIMKYSKNYMLPHGYWDYLKYK